MTWIVATAVIGSLLLSLALTFIVRSWARRIGFVDKPGGHKGHEKPIALGGGIAIFLTITIPLLGGTLLAKWTLASGNLNWVPEFIQPHLSGISDKLPLLLAILGGALVLHVMGLIDDIYALGPWGKLAIQFGVAFSLVAVLQDQSGRSARNHSIHRHHHLLDCAYRQRLQLPGQHGRIKRRCRRHCWQYIRLLGHGFRADFRTGYGLDPRWSGFGFFSL